MVGLPNQPFLASERFGGSGWRHSPKRGCHSRKSSISSSPIAPSSSSFPRNAGRTSRANAPPPLPGRRTSPPPHLRGPPAGPRSAPEGAPPAPPPPPPPPPRPPPTAVPGPGTPRWPPTNASSAARVSNHAKPPPRPRSSPARRRTSQPQVTPLRSPRDRHLHLQLRCRGPRFHLLVRHRDLRVGDRPLRPIEHCP